MKPLLVVAAGGLAREVIAAVRAATPGRAVRAVDDDETRWGGRVHGALVVGGLDAVRDHPDHELVLCAGRGSVRRAMVERLALLGVADQRYATVVHPAVRVPAGCVVGTGSILLEGVVLTADVRVGSHVVAMPAVTLTHDDLVEDYATLCAGVSLGGGVRVGQASYLGMNSCVREGVAIGRDAVLGMGAALVEDLPDGEVWVGVPARRSARVPVGGE